MNTIEPTTAGQVQSLITAIQTMMMQLPVMLQRQMQEVIVADQSALLRHLEEIVARWQSRIDATDVRLKAIEAKLLPEIDADDARMMVAELRNVVMDVELLKEAHALGDSHVP